MTLQNCDERDAIDAIDAIDATSQPHRVLKEKEASASDEGEPYDGDVRTGTRPPTR